MSTLLGVPDVNCKLIMNSGEVIYMSNLYAAKDIAEGLYKGKVDRIEVTQVYKIK